MTPPMPAAGAQEVTGPAWDAEPPAELPLITDRITSDTNRTNAAIVAAWRQWAWHNLPRPLWDTRRP